MTPLRDLRAILATLQPELHAGVYAYVMLPADTSDPALASCFASCIAFVRESEGCTFVLPLEQCVVLHLEPRYRCRWITLQVHSDLAAVGLTAAFATALASGGMSCNVIAGTVHDHVLVDEHAGERAMDVLRDVQRQALAADADRA